MNRVNIYYFKIVFSSLLFSFVSSLAFSQTLSFRVAGPKVVNVSGVDSLDFDIEVKSSTALYVDALQVNFYYNASTLDASKSTIYKKGISNGNGLEGPEYQSFSNSNNSRLNIFVLSNHSWSLGDNLSDYYQQVLTTWTPLLRIRVKMLSNTGEAGVYFDPSQMGLVSNQYYVDDVAQGQQWSNIVLDETHYLRYLYLGRVYSGIYGWSQSGGPLNWSSSVNTSVWDTTTTAAVAGANALANNLRIHPGGRLIVNPSGALTVSGTLANTSNAGTNGLVLKSDATGTASLITNTAAVPATVERYVTGASPYTSSVWHLISPPVIGHSIPAMVGANPFAVNGTKYGLGIYNNSLPGWVTYTTSTLAGAGNFTVGKGYEAMLTANTSLAFKGTLTVANTTSPVTVGSNNWNLIGNPFSAPICANVPASAVNNFITVNAGILPIDYQAVYLWDPSVNAYKTINNTSAATYVQVGQGFFIKAGSAGNASLTAAMRTHALAPYYKNTEITWPSIDLKATIGDQNANTQVFFIPGTTEGVDAGYDAGMIDAFNTDKALYTHMQGSNVGFAIQSLPGDAYENMVVPVGLNAPQGSLVTFAAAITDLPAGIKVYLEDRLKGVFIRLDQAGSSYTCTLNTVSSGTGRFFLVSSAQFVANAKDQTDLFTIIPFPAQRKIRIGGNIAASSEAAIYSINGMKICSFVLPGGMENEIPFSPSANGIYILKIQTGTSVISRKINWVY